jgi:hypothetical protein
MNNIYSMFVVLVYINFLFGMDVAQRYDSKPLLMRIEEKHKPDMIAKAWPIAHCAQILNMPIRDIRSSVEKLPFEQQQVLKHALASNFTFNIAMLPKELSLKILRLAYDDNDQRYNSESFFCTPMMQAITLHQEFKNDSIKIGGKKIQFSTFLMLSPEERKRIREAVNPSKLSSFFDGTSDSVLSQENYETIVALLPDDLEGAQIIRLPSFWKRLKLGLCGHYKICETNSLVLWIGVFGMLQIPFAFGSVLLDSNPKIIMYAIGGILDSGILLGGVLYGISQCRNYIVVVTQVQNQLPII